MPFPAPGNLPDPGIEARSLMSPASAGGFFTTAPPGKQKALVQPLRKAHLRRKDKVGVEPTNTE